MQQVVIDFAVLGVVGGVVGSLAVSEATGAGFLSACLWLALSTLLLGRLLEAITIAHRADIALGLFCAKILAVLILYWLFQAQFLDKWGLTAGILTLPVVLIIRGFTTRQHHQVSEEGR